MAEVFSPWDVDVTTERPSKERLERVDLDDQEFGKEVCITNMPPVSNGIITLQVAIGKMPWALHLKRSQRTEKWKHICKACTGSID